MLAALIRLYQRNRFANTAFRGSVRLHHRIRKPQLQPCPYAGKCSATGIEQVRQLGTMAALPLILSRMSVCGPASGVRFPPKFCDVSTGVDRFEWCIRA